MDVQEPPHFKRSALWRHQRQIAAWLQEGYSFRQVAEELTRQGTKVSARWLQEWYAKNVGRRRSRPRTGTGTGAGRPAHSSASLPDVPTPEAPGMNPSPAPQASVAASPADTDFSALFQSQFKRPRK
jgi:hypothetical protein